MKRTVIQLKDVKEIYGDNWEIAEDLNGLDTTVTKKIGTAMMEEDIPVQIINKLGPYTTVRMHGSKGGFVMPSEKITTKDLPDAITRYKPILDKYFPSRYWYDIDNRYLYLYYPEMTLKNSINLEHKIYDLVVATSMNPESGELSGLIGKRYSFSPSELVAGYIHSHLQIMSKTEGRYTSFCQGSNSHFNKFVNSYKKYNNVKEFELFIIQLQEYLSWESLQGMPYISMTKIGSPSVGNDMSSDYMESDLVTECAIKMLELIQADENAVNQILIITNSGYFLDPSYNAEAFYRIERKLADASEYHDGYFVSWDEASMSYVAGNYVSPEGNHTPVRYTDSYDERIAKYFGITPRIIPEEAPIRQSVIVKRIGINNLSLIIKRVNALLLEGRNLV